MARQSEPNHPRENHSSNLSTMLWFFPTSRNNSGCSALAFKSLAEFCHLPSVGNLPERSRDNAVERCSSIKCHKVGGTVCLLRGFLQAGVNAETLAGCSRFAAVLNGVTPVNNS